MKNKGGRGKKSQYSTLVMRIPSPLKAEVEKLIEEFYTSQKPVTGIGAGGVAKPVTGIGVEGVDKPVTDIEILNLPKSTWLALQRYQINTIEELRSIRDTPSGLHA